MKGEITEVLQIKYKLSEKELADYALEIGKTSKKIADTTFKLEELSTPIKEEIKGLKGELSVLIEKVSSEFGSRPVDCVVKYNEGIAKYYDRATGDLVQERPMTDTEQMRLSGNRVITDAEQIIRRASEEEE